MIGSVLKYSMLSVFRGSNEFGKKKTEVQVVITANTAAQIITILTGFLYFWDSGIDFWKEGVLIFAMIKTIRAEIRRVHPPLMIFWVLVDDDQYPDEKKAHTLSARLNAE